MNVLRIDTTIKDVTIMSHFGFKVCGSRMGMWNLRPSIWFSVLVTQATFLSSDQLYFVILLNRALLKGLVSSNILGGLNNEIMI